jgi:hypothetical protein
MRTLSIGALVSAFVVGLVFFGIGDGSASESRIAEEDGFGTCYTNCSGDEHRVLEMGSSDELENAHENCTLNVYGEDCDNHGACGVHEDLETLVAALQGQDADGTRAVLAEFTGSVYVNAERSAVQVLTCDGLEVRAHIPVSVDLAAVAN